MTTSTMNAPLRPTATRSPEHDGGGDDHDHGHGGPGDTLQNWSSIIGIVTAIVGNMLIALALNVQRYAHTKLHKERARVRQRARAASKRAAQMDSNHRLSSNGVLGGDATGNGYGSIGNGHGNGFNNGSRAGNGAGNGPDGENGNSNGYGRDHDHGGESDPLAASYQSAASKDYQDDDDEDTAASTYLKSPYWWLGQILITLGEMGNFLAYGFAPASIVSPLGVVALVSNCIIAPAMFHEQFRQRDFWGVVIAVGGVVTVVLSANQEETKLNPHDVLDAITTTAFEIYLGVTIALIIVLMWASSRYGRRTILIDLGLVGLFGGYTALATKGVSSMLSSTLWRAFATPVTYVLILILLVTAIMQIRYVNKALQRFDSTQVIPIQFVMFTLCVILGSAILYRDFEKTTLEQAGKFVGGCLLTFFGVFLITSGRQNKGEEDDEEDLLSETDGVEETIGLVSHDGNAPGVPHGPQTPKTQSRRSSRLSKVSFAETLRPASPTGGVDVPAIHYPEPPSTPNSLERESAPLLRDPWHASLGSSSRPPRADRTMSADSVRAATVAGFPSAHFHPATPLRDSLVVVPAQPGDAPTPNRPGLGLSKSGSHHRSSTFISPSPLSSTVTTVVKDAFLRKNDSPLSHKSSMRRIRSSIRASLFFGEDDERTTGPTAIPSSSEDQLARTFTSEGGEADDELIRRRSRSVSDTLGDFFRPKKKKKSDAGSSDVEAGYPEADGGSGPAEEHGA